MAAVGTNVLGAYNPIFYAQEALIQLEKALGMADRVYMGYNEERKAFRKGDTINIRKPSTFTAQAAPSSAAQSVITETVAMTLDSWQEVRFAVSDQQLAYTQDRIIEDHIRPAAYALATKIDTDLCALYKDVPTIQTLTGGGATVAELVATREKMFDNEVDMNVGNLHMMFNGAVEADYLALEAFSQSQGAGNIGVETQRNGYLGRRYGYEIFSNQNVPSHTTGTLADSDGNAALGAAVDKLATSMLINPGVAGSLTGTAEAGDTFSVTTDGVVYNYAVTAQATASGNAVTVSISPPAQVAHADEDVVTLSTASATTTESMAFHRDAFALVMVELPDMANELGARVVSVRDPRTGLAIRSRLYYDGDNSEVNVALDVLYGVKTLNPLMACRMEQ